MIGTHNSFTYQKATFKPYNWFKFLWRCQTKTIEEQKEANVKYFDIRVKWDSKNNCWRTCHGIVSFDKTFNTLEDVLNEFSDVYVRLILEKKNSTASVYFKSEIENLKDTHACLVFACIKKDWEVVFDNDLSLIDYTYTPWLSGLSFWENIKRHNFFSTIKKWAKKHNPDITEDVINSDRVYFMDCV